MAVYLFTFHAYGSWMPDRPRGFVTKDGGVQPTNKPLARAYRGAAQQPPRLFTMEQQAAVVGAARDICDRRGWRLHYVTADPTHLHLLVSWRGFTPHTKVSFTIKRLLGLALSRHVDKTGQRWFSRKHSRKRVTTREHFDHLMTMYLPSHHGAAWSERDR